MLEIIVKINGEAVTINCDESKAELVLQGMLKKVAGTARITTIDGQTNHNKVPGKIISAWYKSISKTKAVVCCKFQDKTGKKVLMYNKPLSINQAYKLASTLKTSSQIKLDMNQIALDMNLWTV